VTDYGLHDRSSIPGRGRDFFPFRTRVVRPALVATYSSVQWVLRVKRPGVQVTTHLPLRLHGVVLS
jgi:hypothetical protein